MKVNGETITLVDEKKYIEPRVDKTFGKKKLPQLLILGSWSLFKYIKSLFQLTHMIGIIVINEGLGHEHILLQVAMKEDIWHQVHKEASHMIEL